MQRLRDLLDLFADNLLPTVVTILIVVGSGAIIWNVAAPHITGISPQAAYTAETAGRIMEIHPKGRADVVCFVLHNPRKDAGDSISCVKENPVQVEKK